MRNTVRHIQAKVHPVTASIFPNLQRVISVSLTVLEIIAWTVDLSLTQAIKSFQKLVLLKR